jgi:cytochrome c553
MKFIATTIAIAFCAAVVRATAGQGTTETPAPVAPPLLSDTGLYAGEGTMQIDPRNRPFSPQYPLWSDGAAKRRWIRLPEGAAIDATDLSRWDFPIGTRFWKEFSFDGRKVETRFLWRVNKDQWVFASYTWNEAQTEAALAPETGIPSVAEVAPGKRHSIPSIAECRSCHDSTRTEILGFDALNLSDDRDPNAPHAETLTPEMITLRTLTEDSLITPKRTDLVTSPPRIEAASPQARAALGYLSTNCGSCHNRESSIASLGLILKHSVTDPVRRGGTSVSAEARSAKVEVPPASGGQCTPALATTAGKRGHWVVPEAQEESRIINPGHPESSALIRRVKSRRPSSQMPPLGTVLVDRQAVDLLTSWVESNPDEWKATIARCTNAS